jgi:hypothetical protein
VIHKTLPVCSAASQLAEPLLFNGDRKEDSSMGKIFFLVGRYRES